MHEAIAEDEQMRDGLPGTYSTVISGSSRKCSKDKNKQLTNCLVWAINHLEYSLGMEIKPMLVVINGKSVNGFDIYRSTAIVHGLNNEPDRTITWVEPGWKIPSFRP